MKLRSGESFEMIDGLPKVQVIVYRSDVRLSKCSRAVGTNLGSEFAYQMYKQARNRARDICFTHDPDGFKSGRTHHPILENVRPADDGNGVLCTVERFS